MLKKLILILFVSISLVTHSGCLGRQNLPYISLVDTTDPAIKEPAGEQDVLRMAIAGFASARETTLFHECAANRLLLQTQLRHWGHFTLFICSKQQEKQQTLFSKAILLPSAAITQSSQ